MSNALIIVESPAKARTLKKYVGKGYDIKASVGHVVDLPTRRLGVDIEHNFQPEYEVLKEKKKVVTEIQQAAAKATVVYLAPDPDREGEAIAWHLAQQIGRKTPVKRVLFNEITPNAVKQALANPTELNRDKFDAQQTRRILDRLVGYQISPILWKKVKRGLSAGRVQSVALRIIVDREKEIRAFLPVEYWTLTARLESGQPPAFDAALTHLNGKPAELGNEAAAHAALEAARAGPWIVTKVLDKTQQSRALPPFTTARLLREASTKLKFNAKRTMSIAQRLYEGIALGNQGEVGLISYMRTDSTRISEEIMGPLRAHIAEKYGAPYLPDRPNFFQAKGQIQDAHEAIRPTSVDRPPETVAPFLKKEELDLYTLIWNRFVASQMTPAIFDQTTADIQTGPATFRANGSVLRFKGHLAVYRDEEEEEKGDDKALPPDLKTGAALKLARLTPKQHFTQPPPRYSEAGLIKALEEKGIGRPSTYAAILTTIQNKDYVQKEKNVFIPSELGILVTDLLIESFPSVMDLKFTAQMEDRLDQVESGRVPYLTVLHEFYDPFRERLEAADGAMRDVKRELVETDIDCETCGAGMVLRWGKNGRFLACSTYPQCTNTHNVKVEPDGRIEILRDPVWSEPCDKCGSPMIVKKSRFGRFLACTAYPGCKNAKPLPTGVACPRDGCGGQLVERSSRKGKLFFSCNRYPQCDFVSWDRPVAVPCPQCNNPYQTEKVTRARGVRRICPQCKHETPIDEADSSGIPA